MPLYARTCTNPKCRLHGALIERFARMSESHLATGPCDECGAPTDIHADALGSVSVQREWSRARGGQERESKAMVFQEAGIPEIKADCPSMEFKVRDGEAVPVFRNDAHHRACCRELSKAKRRYEGERDEKKKQAREKSKREFLISLKSLKSDT
jgi:hypothetical protein